MAGESSRGVRRKQAGTPMDERFLNDQCKDDFLSNFAHHPLLLEKFVELSAPEYMDLDAVIELRVWTP